MVPTQFPLPIPEDLFLQTKGSRYFSKLDLIKGYHNIELHPDSRTLTATLTHLGLHQYHCLPLGLTDVGAVCQKLVHGILADLDGVVTYINNILIFAETVEQHDSILQQGLWRLQAHDFRLQLQKCLFRKTKVPFLGRLLSEHGVRPDMEHVKAIKEAPAPTDFKQLKSFLGLVTYYSPFLPDLATTAELLCAMECGQGKYEWMLACQEAFDSVKAAIGDHLLLMVFDPRCETHVNVDASGVGLGASLTQIQGGQEVTISCASHTLTATEHCYSAAKMEGLACLWAIKKFEKFLLGCHFKLHTDQ